MSHLHREGPRSYSCDGPCEELTNLQRLESALAEEREKCARLEAILNETDGKLQRTRIALTDQVLVCDDMRDMLEAAPDHQEIVIAELREQLAAMTTSTESWKHVAEQADDHVDRLKRKALDLGNERNELRAEIDELRAKVARLQRQEELCSVFEKQRDDLRAKIETAEAERDQALAKVTQARLERDDAHRQRLNDVARVRDVLRAELRAKLGQHARSLESYATELELWEDGEEQRRMGAISASMRKEACQLRTPESESPLRARDCLHTEAAAAYVRDRAEQYEIGSGGRAALALVAAALADGEHLEGFRGPLKKRSE